MKNTVLVVWMCWWMGFCLCHQSYSRQPEPNPYHTMELSQHKPSTSSNTSMTSTISRTSPHPVPGVNEDIGYNVINTPQPHPTVNKTDKMDTVIYGDHSMGHRGANIPPPITDINNLKQNADENLTSVDSAMDKKNQEDPQRSPHSEHEYNSSKPANDNKAFNMAHKPSTAHDHNVNAETEGGRRESHGRVTNKPRDLCSFCLCNYPKKNVFCKHEHTTHDGIHELILDHLGIPGSAKTLHIIGFEMVYVQNDTFSQEDLKLEEIHFENIAHLKFVTNSLHFSNKSEQNMDVEILLTNCTIPEMPQQTFTQMTRSDDPRKDGNLEQTRYMRLKFDRCNIMTMRSYALYNARLRSFHMTKTKVEVMEEKSIHLDIYEKWSIENSHLPNMIHKAVCLRTKSVVVFSHNTFLGLGNRSLDVLSASQVLFEYNKVYHLQSEALLGIRPYENERAANIVFLNNTILKADEGSLRISRKYPMHERKIIANKFSIICDCNVMSNFKKLMGITNTANDNEFKTFKAVTSKSFCHMKDGTDLYAKVKRYADENCTIPIVIIVASSVVGVVILILVIVCVVCTRQVRKAREEANYLGECCVSQSFTLPADHQLSLRGQPALPLEPSSPLQPWVVAVPEVKTYKETELNVAYEHTEPMKPTLRDNFHHEPGPLIRFQCKAEMRSSCPVN